MTKRLLSLLVLFLGITVVACPADAHPSSVSSSDGVLYPGCTDHPYTIVMDPSYAAEPHWNATVTLLAPDGTRASGDYLYTGSSDPTPFTMCTPSDMPGVYTIQVLGTWTDSSYNDHSFTLPNAYFTMRAAQTQTSISATPRHPAKGSVLTVRVKVVDERPFGFFPTSGATVTLQEQTHTGWRRFLKGTTSRSGVVTFKGRVGSERRYILRAVTTNLYDAGSTSAPLTVTTR